MAPLSFRKLHGLGNDFVLFDGLGTQLSPDQLTDPARASRLCDRHLGIGADGLLLLLPTTLPGADIRMRVINADGSEPEMCGNGIRCLAKAAHDHLPAFAGRTRLAVETGAGLLHTELTLDEVGRVASVLVDMGRPLFDRAALPMVGPAGERFVDQLIQAGATELRSTAVSMGNPHLITFVEEADPRELAASLGPVLERHPWFPRRTNVEFARWGRDRVELWVWERGCGLTLACGTGACATAAAAVATGRHAAGQPLRVDLPGGTLVVWVAPDGQHVWMEGPAVEVFQGTVEV